MPSIANISWSFVPGSLSTLVEYRIAGTSIWTIPNSPQNPTPTNTYPLIIDDNTTYDVRLTTNGLMCGPVSTTLQIINVAEGCCPPGYNLSIDGTYCYQTNTTAATPPSSQEITVEKNDVTYSSFGTLIYDLGYVSGGYGPFTYVTSAFWVNSGTLTGGPLNRSGLWATTTAANQDVGFTVCLTLPSDATYYVGCAGDNEITIRLDGVTIVDMDPVAMATYYNTHGFIGLGVDVSFKFWHIYPIMLTAGDHVLEVVGHNDSSIAAMGAEVYNLSSGQIQASTSYLDMGAGLIFSTKDYIGEDVQIGSGGIGYTCPANYSLVLCDGPAYCTRTLTTSTIPCTPTTTSTTSTSTSTSTTTSTTSTTSTSTSTTSSTTSTTTTGAPITVNLQNNASIGAPDITSFTIGGVTPSGFSFPITSSGGSASGILLPAAPGTLAIGATAALGSVGVIDTLGNPQCAAAPTGSITIPGIATTSGGTITVTIEDTPC